MPPIPLGHVENDWKCIAVNLGLLRVVVLIEKKIHEKRLGARETRGNGAFNKHCLQPNPGIAAHDWSISTARSTLTSITWF